MAKGWIKLHRKIFENPILTRSRVFSDLEAWIWIITNANHDTADVLIGADVMRCDRGSIITSQKKLCIVFRWGNSKLRNFLKRLQKCSMICYKTTTKLTQITVIKYDTYQSVQTVNKSVLNRKQTAGKSVLNTNKNVKNVKNDKECKELNKQFDEFYNIYPRKINKKRALAVFKTLSKEDRGKAVEGSIAYSLYIKLNKVSDRYVMHPSTFLNGENWDDYLEGKVQPLTPDMFRVDSTGRFVVGYCSKCQSCESYEKGDVLFEDSRCCRAQLLPNRINKA